MSRNNEANAVLENSIKQDPEDTKFHAVLAHNAYDGGDYQKAAQHFREALRLDPNQTNVRDALLVSLKKGYTLLMMFTKSFSQWGITDLLIFILLTVFLGWVTIPLYFLLPLAINDITEVLITMKRENKFLVSPQKMRGFMLARIPFAVMLLSFACAVLSRFIPLGIDIHGLSFLLFCLSFPIMSATALTFVKPTGILWTIATVCCASFIAFVHVNGGKELALALIFFFTIGFYRFRYIEWDQASE